MRAHLLGLGLALLLGACRTGENYLSPEGPRYSGAAAVATDRAPGTEDTIHVVSFNVEFAVNVDRAIGLLTSHPDLRGADVVLLQEMDAVGTRRIADALGLSWVYHPAIRSLRTGRDFGNAILARWPIVDDDKLILPHHGRPGRTQRIATAASLDLGRDTIRVYSIHFGSAVEIGDAQRRDQLRTVLDDADHHPRVVIGGDTNDEDAGRVAVQRGYDWPTLRGPRTTSVGRWDHVFIRGLVLADSAAAGTVLDARDASDHRPVWVRLAPVAEPQTRQ